MSEKEYLISLIDRFLDDYVGNDRDKNISYFRDVLSKINDNGSYVYEFIVGINEGLIEVLTDSLDSNSRLSFLDDFNSLRDKISLLRNDGKDIKLSKIEEGVVDKFRLLLGEYCKDSNLSNFCYLKLRDKFCNNLALDICDYDIISDLIFSYADNVDVEYEEAMDYLNRYNIVLIRKFSKPSKKKVKYVKVGESKSDVSSSLNDALSDVVNNDINPFDNMVSFDFVPKERSRTNRKRKVVNEVKKVEDVCDLFNKYGYNYELVSEFYRNELKGIDVNSVKGYFEFFANNKLDVFSDDLKGLCYLLCNISFDDFVSNYEFICNSYDLNIDGIKELFRRFVMVFSNDELDNFKLNYGLLNSCDVHSVSDVVMNNIVYFMNDYNDNLDKFNTLSSLGINVKCLVKNALDVFCLDKKLLVKNIQVLDNYGFDLRDETDFKSFSVLGINNLSRVLDMFIEMGLSEFIHDNPVLTLRNIKSLIIKRVLFAYRNGLGLWDNNGDGVFSVINDEYEGVININLKTLDSSEIELLISEYPILELLEYGKRLSSYNDSYFGNIRRNTEFVFGNKIISRIKTYSIFKVLVEFGVKDEDALVYALMYNLDVNKSEYDSIRNVVYRGSLWWIIYLIM